MRSLNLAKSGWNKIRGHQKELKAQDIEESLKSLPPGEWCVFSYPGSEEQWVGFVNPLIEEKYSCVFIVHVLKKNAQTLSINFSPEEFIQSKLRVAFQKRMLFEGYSLGARLFYGASDGLPGLVIDSFHNKAIIQINTAGIDRFRELIRTTISDLIGGEAYFLDNPRYREKEFLPTFGVSPLPDLKITENGLNYSIRSEVVQKVGFYYDHRENRFQFRELLKRLKKCPERGVDLFCYAGAWGLNALKGGASYMEFVDQGDFSQEIVQGLDQNGLKGKGQYFRQDVFKYLDEAFSQKKKFDLILCDPPAFAKSHLQKDQALDGYSKLHRKVFKLAEPNALLAFSSCTHYVTHQEFQKNILDAASKENKKIQLLHCGSIGWDHPIASLDDRASYIKSYFYLME